MPQEIVSGGQIFRAGEGGGSPGGQETGRRGGPTLDELVRRSMRIPGGERGGTGGRPTAEAGAARPAEPTPAGSPRSSESLKGGEVALPIENIPRRNNRTWSGRPGDYYKLSELEEMVKKIDLPWGVRKKIELKEDTGEEKIYAVYDPEQLKTVDQIARALLEQLNFLLTRDAKITTLERSKILDPYLWQLRNLIELENGQYARSPDKDPRYKSLGNWVNTAVKVSQTMYDHIYGKISSGENLGKIAQALKEGFDNATLTQLLVGDPGITYNMLSVTGILNDRVFREGFKDPATGREIVKGGHSGGAEKLGYWLYWITGLSIFSGRKVAGEKVYPLMQIHYDIDYLLSKGFYKGMSRRWLQRGNGPIFNRLTGDVVDLSPFPTMWHDPMAMTDFWYDNFTPEKIGWRNFTRMLCWYGEHERRRLGEHNELRQATQRDWQNWQNIVRDHGWEEIGWYLWQDFEGASFEEQQQMFEMAKAYWKYLTERGREGIEQQKLIIANNLLRTKRKLDHEGKMIEGTFTPLLDLMERERVIIDGREIMVPVVDFSRLNMEHFGTHGMGGNLSRFYVYENYAYEAYKLIRDIANTAPGARAELYKRLTDLINPDKGGLKHLYEELGIEGRPERAMAVREMIIDKWWEYYSEMILKTYIWDERKRGVRTEVAEMINNFIRMGLFREYYRKYEFEAAGIYGKDWTNLIYTPFNDSVEKVDPVNGQFQRSETLAKILVKMGDREVWEHVLRKIGFVNREGKGDFEALVALAGYRIVREYKEVTPEGDLAPYVEFRLLDPNNPDDVAWRRQHLDKDKIKRLRMHFFTEDAELCPFFYDKDTGNLGVIERMDEDRIIDGMIDSFVDEVFFKDKRNHIRRRWFLPYDPGIREILFNKIKRRQKYTIGPGAGYHVLDQVVFNKEGQPENIGYFFIDKEYVSSEDRKRLAGLDKVGSICQGSGELFAGLEKRLTPIYLYYDKTRMKNLVLAIFASPYFRAQQLLNIARLAKKKLTWESEKMWQGIMNPTKLSLLINELGDPQGAGIDSDVLAVWQDEWGADVLQVKYFEEERKKHLVPDIEGKFDIERENYPALETMQGVVSEVVGKEVSGLFSKVPMRTPKERAAVVKGAIAGWFVSGGEVLIGAALLSGGIPLGLFLTAGLTSLLGASLGGFLSADRGDGISGWRLVIGHLLGTYRQRELKRSFRQIYGGFHPVWDDAVPHKAVAKLFFVIPKQRLQRYTFVGK